MPNFHHQTERTMKCNSQQCSHTHQTNDLQRRHFLQYLAAGLFTTMVPAGSLFAAEFTPPQPLPVGRSIFRMSGRAWVNGNQVDSHTRIGPNDTVKTSHDGELVFVVGSHAMLLRGDSHLVLHAAEKSTSESPVIGLLRLLSGKLLSVSRNKGMRINTPTATIGIRGTGVYLEAEPDKTLFCTCYGDIDITANHDAASRDTVHATHHDRPLIVFNQALPGKSIRNARDPEFSKPGDAPKLIHSDEELMMIEALVGRTPPFSPHV
jgi:FecR protein